MIRMGILAVAAGAVLAGIATPAQAATPADLPSYQQWQADVRQAIGPAIPWLQNRVAQGGSRLAIVLDVDNTALETQYHFDDANKPVLAAAQWAHAHGVAVLFASTRPDLFPGLTNDQLRDAGYQVDGLCLAQLGDKDQAGTKQRCRQQYTHAGYTITENIGNRVTDLEGGNYEKGFKLPDYSGQLL